MVCKRRSPPSWRRCSCQLYRHGGGSSAALRSDESDVAPPGGAVCGSAGRFHDARVVRCQGCGRRSVMLCGRRYWCTRRPSIRLRCPAPPLLEPKYECLRSLAKATTKVMPLLGVVVKRPVSASGHSARTVPHELQYRHDRIKPRESRAAFWLRCRTSRPFRFSDHSEMATDGSAGHCGLDEHHLIRAGVAPQWHADTTP
jgi:hypothetical protein